MRGIATSYAGWDRKPDAIAMTNVDDDACRQWLRRLDPRSAPALTSLFDEMTPEARSELRDDVAVLMAQGVRNLDDLTRVATTDRTTEHRAAGVWLLGFVPTAETEEALLRSLTQDPAAEVREVAIGALERREAARAAVLLPTVLRSDPGPEVRARAALALPFLAGDESYRDLVDALLDSKQTSEVRAAAADALHYVSARPETIDALLRALDDPAAEVRFSAASSLGSVGGSSELGKLKAAAVGDAGVSPYGSVAEAASDAAERLEARLRDDRRDG